MQRLHVWIPPILFIFAFVAIPVSADQGKAKGHDKQAQHENKGKSDRRVGTSGAHMRFQGLDKNNDGVITRAEWRGNDQSFRNQDWNGDGVLSGNEVQPGAKRPSTARTGTAPPPASTGHDPDAAVFAHRDVNRDGVLTRAEFGGSVDDFNRVDFNKDGVLSPYEFGVGR